MGVLMLSKVNTKLMYFDQKKSESKMTFRLLYCILLQSNFNYPDLNYLDFFYHGDLFLCRCQFSWRLISHMSAAKLFSFKLWHDTPERTEFVSLQRTNLNMLTYVRNNYYSAFYWALMGSDLLSCWVHELFIFVLVSLIFIFWIIVTLHYPDHSAHSLWVQIMEVWLYFYYYLCFSDNHLMRKFFLL